MERKDTARGLEVCQCRCRAARGEGQRSLTFVSTHSREPDQRALQPLPSLRGLFSARQITSLTAQSSKCEREATTTTIARALRR
jgi:hypothetical protein